VYNTLDIQLVACGLRCMDGYLKLTGSLLAVEQSCCDGVEVKVSRRIVSQRDLNLNCKLGGGGSGKETILPVQAWRLGERKSDQ
jgi:hypothetical protein